MTTRFPAPATCGGLNNQEMLPSLTTPPARRAGRIILLACGLSLSACQADAQSGDPSHAAILRDRTAR
jgi:hypothetical protein